MVSAAPGQSTGWDVKNNTGHTLHVYLAGPVNRDFLIPAGESRDFDVPAGSYRIAADVPSSSIVPFYADRTLPADSRWESNFYIR